MAYAVAEELRNQLPNKGRGVTNMRLNAYVSEGQSLIALGDPNAPETDLSRRAVEEYAIAEALREMRRKGDNISNELIEQTEGRATRFMDAYRASTPSSSDDSPDRPKAVVSGTPW